MDFSTLLNEIMTLVNDYKSTASTLSRKDVQEYRDNLASLSVTLAVYAADFYEDAIGAEIKRKIAVARETDSLLEEVKTISKAEIRAMVTCEQFFLTEASCQSLHNRAKFVREQINHVLNSMASRMQTDVQP